jgi:galactosylgalactosylxylosylprotein 3-beta-glucuronosyltransferase 3
MSKYTLLNRRMSNDIRLSYRQAIVIGIITFISFLYALSGDSSCNKIEESAASSAISENGEHLPIIYAVTPTYYRPVQKAELTR